jgi:RNA polymerase sigma factor (TIGR02999 family)
MEQENKGDALDDMFSLAYEELRRLASRLNRNPGATLNPTALVNEAWLRLSHSGSASPQSMAHFKAVAARAMRHVLIDAARRRNAAKRGGLDEVLPMVETLDGNMSWDKDLMALSDALDELEQFEPRQARIVEYRYFGGYSVQETADLLGIAEPTVQRDWRVARAWLKAQIKRA